MTPDRAVAITVLILTFAAASVALGGWKAVLAGVLLMNVGVVAIASWRGRSSLSKTPKLDRDRVPDGVLWC